MGLRLHSELIGDEATIEEINCRALAVVAACFGFGFRV